MSNLSKLNHSNKIKVGIIGATGYAGLELVRLLLSHPDVEIAAISSVSFEGKALSEVYPNLLGLCDAALQDEGAVIAASDVVFAALPHGLSEPLAEKCVGQGKLFIDLGADFRLADEDTYKQWYGLDYKHPALHQQSVYCVPELHRDRITADTQIIANPGCYTTCIPLALAPIIKSGHARLTSIIVDAKSGVTGAGRSLTQNTHFAELNEGFAAYKVASHRHTPEMEQTLSELAGEEITLTFVPHLLPVNRGILATCYVDLNTDIGLDEAYALYEKAYANERFVRLLPKGKSADIKNVKYSNYCDISLHYDTRCKRLIVTSCIDNMVKGAAGQAIQNMNIAMGLDEAAGLLHIPPAF